MTHNSDQKELQRVKLQLMQVPGVQAVGEVELQAQASLKVYFSDAQSMTAADLESITQIPILKAVVGRIEAQEL